MRPVIVITHCKLFSDSSLDDFYRHILKTFIMVCLVPGLDQCNFFYWGAQKGR